MATNGSGAPIVRLLIVASAVVWVLLNLAGCGEEVTAQPVANPSPVPVPQAPVSPAPEPVTHPKMEWGSYSGPRHAIRGQLFSGVGGPLTAHVWIFYSVNSTQGTASGFERILSDRQGNFSFVTSVPHGANFMIQVQNWDVGLDATEASYGQPLLPCAERHQANSDVDLQIEVFFESMLASAGPPHPINNGDLQVAGHVYEIVGGERKPVTGVYIGADMPGQGEAWLVNGTPFAYTLTDPSGDFFLCRLALGDALYVYKYGYGLRSLVLDGGNGSSLEIELFRVQP